MGAEKTISIDPSLFTGGSSKGKSKSGKGSNDSSSGHNRTLKRERKVRPKVTGPSPNTLRKNLLAKIKEHQKKEQVETKRKNLLEESVKPSSNSNEPNVFEDEFTRSLAYLSNLAKSRENARAEKKNKAKLKFKNGNGGQITLKPTPTQTTSNQSVNVMPATIVTPTPSISSPIIQSSQVTTNRHQSTIKRLPDQPSGTGNQQFKQNTVPEISLDMPPEFDVTPKVEVNVLPVNTPSVTIRNDPPYGVLKGGTKPTYRDFSRTQKNPSSYITNKPVLGNHIDHHQKQSPSHPPQLISVKQHINDENDKLKERMNETTNNKKLVIKPNYQDDVSNSNETGGNLNQNQNHNQNQKKARKSKTVKRTTSVRHFKLGKDAKRRVISVFIKNNKTRRRIKLEIGQLKRVPIKDVKSYLRKHNLLKVGSSAPNDVLRHLYEQSVLSGDVHNLSKDTLIHNYLNDKE